MTSKKIILIAGRGESTNIVFNAINNQFGVESVLIEDKEPTKLFLTRRIKKLGVVTVIGQVLFQLLIAKPLGKFSKGRVKEIVNANDLKNIEIPSEKVHNVTSINADTSISLLKQLKPDLIIVHGTRIISKKVLAAVDCKFINMHAGITPKYRGVHGTYWALVNNDEQNSGVTVHFVDSGIDTGNIISQSTIKHTAKDNFTTYPMLQLAKGLSLLLVAIQDVFNNTLHVQQEPKLESKLWYHPTIWKYLYCRVFKGVK